MNTKQLLLATAIMLLSVVAYAQDSVPDARQFQRDFVSVKADNAYPLFANEEKRSISFNEEKYQKFRRMRKGGIILTAVGAGLITGGLILLETTDSYDHYENGHHIYSDDDDANIVGGVVCVALGTLSTGGGITMWVIGNNKMKKYGGGQISVQPGKNGVGLAYRF